MGKPAFFKKGFSHKTPNPKKGENMNRYQLAREAYSKIGVDTDKAIQTLKDVTVSVHCWQGDDVVGFDSRESLSGGIQTTGNYPGKATTPEELMADIDKAFSLIPGKRNSICMPVTRFSVRTRR